MIANSIIAASALLSVVAAVPFAQPPYAKRDVVWETHTEVALTTIPVTVTHWLEPGETPPVDVAAAGGKGHWGHKGKGHGKGHGHGKSEKPGKPETTDVPAPPAPAPTSQAPPAYTPEPQPEPTTQAAPTPAAPTSQAPPPAYTPEPQPEPTTQQAPPPAYTPKPEPAPSQPSGGSGSGQSYTGEITHWTPALGACGMTNTEQEMVVAVSTSMYDASMTDGNPNNADICKKTVTIQGKKGPVQAEVVDRCGGCADTDLDLSPTLFEALGYGLGEGRVAGIKWTMG